MNRQHALFDPFRNPLDFHGYNIGENKVQMTYVKVISDKPNPKGRKCQPFDFFTIQFKGFMKEGN